MTHVPHTNPDSRTVELIATGIVFFGVGWILAVALDVAQDWAFDVEGAQLW